MTALAPTGSAPDLDREVARALERHAAAGRIALVDDRESVSYRELADRVDIAASAVRGLGLPSGATVALAATKGIPLVVTLLAVLRAGHCACVLEPRLPAADVAGRASAFGIARILADSDVHAELAPALGSLVTPLAELGRDNSRPPVAPRTDPGLAALMLFTSGSTGAPKAIRLTRANLIANARGVVERTGLTPADRLLHLMPFHHTNGINNQLLAPLLAGASVALIPRFRAELVEEQIERFRPTIITGVPTMYLRMLPHLAPGRRRPSLRMLRCGSAPLTTTQHEQIEAAFGVPLIQSYGLSEATCTSAMNPPDAPRRGTVGTVLDGQEVRIIHPGSGDDLPAGVEGEICIGGHTVMGGYVGEDPGIGPVREGLLHTGDLGRLDPDGYLTVTGRLKDVVIRGGENLSPAAIEAALTGHPGVTDAAVIGAPHHDLGEVPAAFVVPVSAGSSPTVAELREHVLAALGRIHVPEQVHLVSALPLNAVGKIDKKELRRRLAVGERERSRPSHP